jgi:hypothetical protein
MTEAQQLFRALTVRYVGAAQKTNLTCTHRRDVESNPEFVIITSGSHLDSYGENMRLFKSLVPEWSKVSVFGVPLCGEPGSYAEPNLSHVAKNTQVPDAMLDALITLTTRPRKYRMHTRTSSFMTGHVSKSKYKNANSYRQCILT